VIENLRITVLAENTVRHANLLAEHGLALWIEADGHRILFDTGQGHVLRHNAEQLEIPLDTADVVVLSHGHFDHTGGLNDVLSSATQCTLCLHPAALEKKYARERTPPHRSIGISGLNEQVLRRRTQALVWTLEPTKLMDGVHLTGEIPRRNDFEDTGGPFYLDDACSEADPLLDDQALYIEMPAGIIVVLGCAHAGVINTLNYIAELTDRKRICAVLGGMHLVGASARRLERTIDNLHEMRIGHLGPAHCTGRAATAALWAAMPDRCIPCHVGTRLKFDLSTHSKEGA